jgi:hypothetical protein
MRRGREEASDRNDGMPFTQQEQRVGTTAYPGIGISPAQLAQRLLLRTQVP